MFGDDPLDTLFFDDPEKQDSLFSYVIADFYVRGVGKDSFQEFFSPDEGQARQIVSREMEEIEDVVDQMAKTGFPVILKHLEIGMAPDHPRQRFRRPGRLRTGIFQAIPQSVRTSG